MGAGIRVALQGLRIGRLEVFTPGRLYIDNWLVAAGVVVAVSDSILGCFAVVHDRR